MGKEFSTTIQGAANKVSGFIIVSFFMQRCDLKVFLSCMTLNKKRFNGHVPGRGERTFEMHLLLTKEHKCFLLISLLTAKFVKSSFM